jgi:hypothetical protein
MPLKEVKTKALPITEELLQLLRSTQLAQVVWSVAVKDIDASCDEVWLARMWEVESLEARYRTCQDRLFFYLKQAIEI